MGKPKPKQRAKSKRTTAGKPRRTTGTARKGTTKRITPDQVRAVVENLLRTAAPDPPGTVVIEMQRDQGSAVGEDGMSAAERASAIQLHKRLFSLEHMSRRILNNPETAPRRRELAEHILRGVQAAHTWATRFMQSGGDLRTLMTLGGWKTIQMVIRYAHSDQDHAAQALARMVAAFPVPALVPGAGAAARGSVRKDAAIHARGGV